MSSEYHDLDGRVAYQHETGTSRLVTTRAVDGAGYSPCGIHLFRRRTSVCHICLRLIGELRDTSVAHVFTDAERQTRREAGQKARSSPSPIKFGK